MPYWHTLKLCWYTDSIDNEVSTAWHHTSTHHPMLTHGSSWLTMYLGTLTHFSSVLVARKYWICAVWAVPNLSAIVVMALNFFQSSEKLVLYHPQQTKNKLTSIYLQYVKDQLERVPDRFTSLWKWRTVEEGKQCNGLEEGEAGPREMSKLKMAKRKYLKSFFGDCVNDKVQPKTSNSQSKIPPRFQTICSSLLWGQRPNRTYNSQT